MQLYVWLIVLLLSFFFQAEDGIRDIGGTGVQTCALPIYRLRRVLAHVGGAHLVNAEADAAIMLVDVDVGAAGHLQHLALVLADLLDHLLLVVAEAAIDVDQRHAPFVLAALVQRDPVLRPRQHFAEAAEADPPRARAAQALLELGAGAGTAQAALPGLAHHAALEAVAAGEALGG